MGSDQMVLPLLDFLYSNGGEKYQLMGIVTQPDRPSGRGQKLAPNPVSAWALERNLRLFRPEKPSEEEFKWLQEEGIDLVFVMAYGHIIKKEMLNTPELGMFNFHLSLLPEYRGASPVETALACGESETGISLMQMVVKMDAGDVIDKEIIPITSLDNSTSLRLKIAKGCVPLIARNIKNILEGNCQFSPQDESKATYTRKISKEDGWINFNASAQELDCRIRAFTPWPGGYFKVGEMVIKIGSCETLEMEAEGKPGTIIGLDEKGLLIATGKGVLRLTSLQRPGGKMLAIHEFLRGFPLKESIKVEGGPMAPLVSDAPFPWKSKIDAAS